MSLPDGTVGGLSLTGAPTSGYAGTYFWIDPEEELVGVLMSQAPSPARAYYRRHMKQLVYQAIVE